MGSSSISINTLSGNPKATQNQGPLGFDPIVPCAYTRRRHWRGRIKAAASGNGPQDQAQLKRLLVWQLIFAAASLTITLPFGVDLVVSVLIGAGVCLLANWIFAWWVFRRYRAKRPGEITARMYVGEIIKIMTILLLFGLAFASIETLNLPALLGTYFAVQVLPALFASRSVAGDNESDSTS